MRDGCFVASRQGSMAHDGGRVRPQCPGKPIVPHEETESESENRESLCLGNVPGTTQMEEKRNDAEEQSTDAEQAS